MNVHLGADAKEHWIMHPTLFFFIIKINLHPFLSRALCPLVLSVTVCIFSFISLLSNLNITLCDTSLSLSNSAFCQPYFFCWLLFLVVYSLHISPLLSLSVFIPKLPSFLFFSTVLQACLVPGLSRRGLRWASRWRGRPGPAVPSLGSPPTQPG